MNTNLFEYNFIVTGLIAGIAIGIIAPLVGMFLVLRRYSLIADTLSHVSLAGIAIGLFLGINPLITAIAATVVSSVFIEKLRLSKKTYGESALALFLSGSLAIAVVVVGISKGLNSTLIKYLFGSVATVNNTDLIIILILAVLVTLGITLIFKKLLYATFDEESAKVMGIKTNLLNLVFILLSAITISFAIPVTGVLLISALLVIPVITALQLRKPFTQTIIIAQVVSVFSVVAGIIISFYLDLPPGGAIVLITLLLFLIASIVSGGKSRK